MPSVTCLALVRGRQCTARPAANSRWCTTHEEQQHKSLKSYKRISFELEAFQTPHVTFKDISVCTSTNDLDMWAASMRKKWILIKRTIDSRIKHHITYCAGGDISHLAFIAGLTAQRDELEALLLRIDDRAYDLLLRKEDAEWLNSPAPAGPQCSETVALLPATLLNEDESSLATTDEAVSAASSESDDNIFSDVSTETNSSNSCASDCCCEAPTPKQSRVRTKRERLLAYLDYGAAFESVEETAFAGTIMDNIFRYTISRVPRLLVRARTSGCTSINSFIASESLNEEECESLCRALKYNNAQQEGKITVDVIRNAICDAENEQEDRTGAFIELLGGKVYKSSLDKELSDDGWNHFYRFTSCSGCALSATKTFSAWARNRQLSRSGDMYSTWAEPETSDSEDALRAMGAVFCGGYKKGKSGALEHVKPKKRGLKSVWIERDSRNYVFLRFAPGNKGAQRLLDHPYEGLAVWSWPLREVCSASTEEDIWMSRLRSGNTPAERKAARWTVDTSFKYSDCTHKRLLSTSPETYFHSGKAFDDGSTDAIVVDTSREQKHEMLLERIVSAMQSNAAATPAPARSSCLHDKAFYQARTFFKEV